MHMKKIKNIPSDTLTSVDVVPYTVMSVGASHIRVEHPQSISMFLEDIRGFMVELNFDLENLIYLKRIVEDGVSLSKTPIKIRTTMLYASENVVELNPEKSLHVSTKYTILEYDKLIDDSERLGNLYDLGACYVSHNKEFLVFLSPDPVGRTDEDIFMVSLTTVVSALIKIQSEYVFNSMELLVLNFSLETMRSLVVDTAVISHGMSTLMFRDKTLQVVHNDLMGLFKKISRSDGIPINPLMKQLLMFEDKQNSYSKVYKDSLQTSGRERTKETKIKIIPNYGSNCRPLVFYQDCSVDVGVGVKRFYKLEDRIEDRTEFGRGNPPSLMKVYYMDNPRSEEVKQAKSESMARRAFNKISIFAG